MTRIDPEMTQNDDSNMFIGCVGGRTSSTQRGPNQKDGRTSSPRENLIFLTAVINIASVGFIA